MRAVIFRSHGAPEVVVRHGMGQADDVPHYQSVGAFALAQHRAFGAGLVLVPMTGRIAITGGTLVDVTSGARHSTPPF
jgi:hypothetical protein